MAAHPELAEFVAGRYRALVHRAYLLTGDVEAASDLVQSTLERLYPRWGRLRDGAAVDAFVYRTMLRLYLNNRRGSQRSRHVEARAAGQKAGTTPDPSGAVVDRLVIEDALGALTAIQRTVLVLRYWDDLPVSQVAELLRCSESTVRTHTQRAIERLRLGGILIDSPGGGHD